MDVIRSKQFDDIYFSPDGGLAETQHVFLQGNGLPERWKNQPEFTIFETGFGTGLNFLAAWDLFARTAKPDQVLHYISVEKYPLSANEIRSALSHWHDELGDKIKTMLDHYPLRIDTFHRLCVAPNIYVTLLFDDISSAIEEVKIPYGVDAWFLDGFAPSKNPDMWSESLFKAMAKLSAPDATVATFTAAGLVKRGLAENGFEVEKVRGFGRKRDMITARFVGENKVKHRQPKAKRAKDRKVAIIGGGLAGTSSAYVLAQRGMAVTLFEQSDSLAAGASGNPIGLYNPRLYAQRNPESLFYRAAFSETWVTLKKLAQECDIDFHDCGALHLITDETKEKRFQSMVEEDGWHTDHARIISAGEASHISGVEVNLSALYLPNSGFVSPEKLCHSYASLSGADIRLSEAVSDVQGTDKGWLINGEHFDELVLACGIALLSFAQSSWLPLNTVQGQISYGTATKVSEQLRTCICYGGYIAPAQDGQHVFGATFQRWKEDLELDSADDQRNLEGLATALPDIAKDMRVTSARAGFRTSSQDRVPILGALHPYDIDQKTYDLTARPLYVSTGHGSHGIVSSLMGAEIIADQILSAPSSLPSSSIDAVSAERFVKRWQRKSS